MDDLYNFFFRARKCSVLVSVFILYNPVFAQENIRFQRISVNEGLSQSDVKCMMQDRLGFLWVGTRDGLNVFDGFEFRTYTREKSDTGSLAFNQILDLEMDSSGNIWVGSTGGISIYRYKENYFQNFFLSDSDLPDVDVYHILLTSPTTALLSTSKGVISFDLEQQRFFIDPTFTLFKDLLVLNMFRSRDHGFWVGTSKGVFKRTSTESGWINLLNDTGIHRIKSDNSGKIYLCSSRGLFTYDLDKEEITQVPLPPEFTSVTDVLRADNGDFWVVSNKVIILNDQFEVRFILRHDASNSYSLSEDRARVIYKTRDGVIWVGTFGYGLNKFNPDVTSFSYLGERTTLPLSGNYVSSVYTFNDTTVFVGTSRGLDVIDLITKSTRKFTDHGDLFQILKIRPGSNERIWVTTSKGLMLYSGHDLLLKNASMRSVYDFDEWDDTHFILATRVNGIFLFNKKTNKTDVLIPATELPEEVSCIRAEGDYLWVGCKDGLRLFSRRGTLIKLFSARTVLPGSLHSSFIKSIYRDSKRNLWIGTWGGGFSKFNDQDSTFITYTTIDGLPNNVVYGMLEDRTGILWLSTNSGISAFNPTNITFRNFTFSDGLQSNEFNTGAYFQSANDKLYFGGVNGLSFFHPAEILKQHPLPSILTTSILINNQPLAFQGTDSLKNVRMIARIQSDWKANDLGIKFSAIDFIDGQKREFQYAVTDTSWFDIGTRRSLELIDLPSGEHTLQVRTRMAGSSWSPKVALLTIVITPPIWQRAWFQASIVLSFLLFAFVGYRIRVVRLQRANDMLNKLVGERTKEIQAKNEEIVTQNDQLHALNRELEAFSFSVSHDLRSPLRTVIGYSKILEEDYQDKLDDEARQILGRIRQKALKMNTLVNDLLQFSRMSKQEMQKSETNMEILVSNILDDLKPSIPGQVEIRLQSLPTLSADNKLISQVWINLLSNAFKYSSRKTNPIIEIGSRIDDHEITFYVRDNGAGFDMKYVDKLFGVFQRLHKTEEFDGIGVGLALVHRIVSRHGGRVWAEGKVDEGAVFYFALPKQENKTEVIQRPVR